MSKEAFMRHVTKYLSALLTSTFFLITASVSVSAQPTLSGNDLLFNGESFFHASNIRDEMSRLAREDGVLSQGDKFNQVAISGAPMGDVINQFKNANPKPKFVITDGGGIDLMWNNCQTGDVNCGEIQTLKGQLEDYIEEMKNAGVKKFIWMCYPDPVKSYAGALKTGQDIWAVVAKEVIDATEEPIPLWVDMREAWEGHYDQYTGDGIHCTDAGGTACAVAFWEAIKADNYAFLDTTTTATKKARSIVNGAAPAITGKMVANRTVAISLTADRSADITMQLTTVSGRSVFSTKRQAKAAGLQTVEFPLGRAVTPGVYCCKVMTQQSSMQTKLLVGR